MVKVTSFVFVYFFIIQVGLHACGVATDMVMEHCIQAGAAFVISPCCYGFIQNAVKFTFPKRFVLVHRTSVQCHLWCLLLKCCFWPCCFLVRLLLVFVPFSSLTDLFFFQLLFSAFTLRHIHTHSHPISHIHTINSISLVTVFFCTPPGSYHHHWQYEAAVAHRLLPSQSQPCSISNRIWFPLKMLSWILQKSEVPHKKYYSTLSITLPHTVLWKN